MEYSIHALSKLTGLTTRTLRWYDKIGLLPPARVEGSGYRYYGGAQVDRLQQILFYRELGVGLTEIGKILDDPSFSRLDALHGHLRALRAQRMHIEGLIETVEQTINKEERGERMRDSEKFAAFKRDLVEENERKYGQEIREKYGDETIDRSNAKMMGLSEADYRRMTELGAEINKELARAVRDGETAQGEAGRTVAEMHRQWLQITSPHYSAAMHRGLGEMYVADERFTAYYDGETPGCAQFLRDAIDHWITE